MQPYNKLFKLLAIKSFNIMKNKQFNTVMEPTTFIRYNFGVNLLYICNNYNPHSHNFDQYHVGDTVINGIVYSVVFRTYY